MLVHPAAFYLGAKPEGKGPFPGVVLIHHLPGWSELYIETTRRFAHHGYLAICANLYQRAGEGNPRLEGYLWQGKQYEGLVVLYNTLVNSNGGTILDGQEAA